MSKWRKPLKNKKRFDARYFLNERMENQEEVMENSVQQEKLKKNFHDFSFDSWLIQEKKSEEEYKAELARRGVPEDEWDYDWKVYSGYYREAPRPEKQEYDSAMWDLDEGADKGTPSWDDDEEESKEGHIDYEKGKIGGSVVEEEKTVIGGEEEEEEYGEQEADDSESTESAPAIKEYRGPGDDEDLYTPGGKLRPSKMQRAKRERELDAERKRDAAAKAKRGKQSDDAKAAWKAHMAKNES